MKKFILILMLTTFSFKLQAELDTFIQIDFNEKINQLSFSITGDSVFVTGPRKFCIYNKDGNLLFKDTMEENSFKNAFSISSDLKSYTRYRTKPKEFEHDLDESCRFDIFNISSMDSVSSKFFHFPYMKYYNYGLSQLQAEYITKFDTTIYYLSKSVTVDQLYGKTVDIEKAEFTISSKSNYIFWDTENEQYQNRDIGNDSYEDRELIHKHNILNGLKNDIKYTIYYSSFFKLISTDNYKKKKSEYKSESQTGVKLSNVKFSENEKIMIGVELDKLFIYDLNNYIITDSLDFSNFENLLGFFEGDSVVAVSRMNSIYIFNLNNKSFYGLATVEGISQINKLSINPFNNNDIIIASDDKLIFLNLTDFTKIKADFQSYKTTSQINDTTNFINTSIGKNNNYYWEFGDGETSEEFEPKHLYKNTGEYSVKLFVTNENGVDSIIRENYINIVPKQLNADFSYALDNSSYPFLLILNNESSGDYQISRWKVGTLESDSHSKNRYRIYKPGIYEITLEIFDKDEIFHDKTTKLININYKYKDSVKIVKKIEIDGESAIEPKNLIKHNDTYFVNYLYKSNQLNMLKSKTVKFDSKLDTVESIVFTSENNPPNSPIIYNDKLYFKKDTLLSKNDISLISTDLDFNVYDDFSEIISDHTDDDYNNNNVQSIIPYKNKLYVLANISEGESSKLKIYDYNNKNINLLLSTYPSSNGVKIFFKEMKSKVNNDTLYVAAKIVNYEAQPFEIIYYISFMKIYNDEIINQKLIYQDDNFLINSIVVDGNFAYICTEKEIIKYNLNENNFTSLMESDYNSSFNKIKKTNDKLIIIGKNNNLCSLILFDLKSMQTDTLNINLLGELQDVILMDNGNLLVYGLELLYPFNKVFLIEIDKSEYNITSKELETIIDNDSMIKISPNPASDYIEISVDGAHPEGGHYQIEIYDVLGNKIFNSTFNTLTPALSLREREHRIDVSQLPKGVYFVKIGDKVEKFVKM